MSIASFTDLRMTNETYPFWPDYGNGPRMGDKVSVRLNTAWKNYMRKIMGDVYDRRFTVSGYGFMDGNIEEDIHKLQAISCGGNLVKVTGLYGKYAYVAHQWFEDGPNPEYTFLRYPWLNTMQMLSGDIRGIFYRNAPNTGTIWFPILSHRGIKLSILREQLEYFPALPFETEWHGEPITVTDYSFYGHDVYGLVNGQWRILEHMNISGHGSVLLDRVIHVTPSTWIQTPGVSNVGWREGDTRTGTGVLF